MNTINKAIASFVPCFPKKFVWVFSRKYIAGETIKDAIAVSRDLNSQGVKVTVDLLGEFIKTLGEANRNKEEYLNIVRAFQDANVDGNFSIKPTSFGLLIDQEKCYENVREVVALAAGYNSFVRIDMEDAASVDLELALYKRLKAEFPKNVGLVLQAYLYRTENDIDELLKIHTPESPLNFRLCKGIYVESDDISIKDPKKINENYLKLLDKLLTKGVKVGIATHDKELINGAYEIIGKYKVPHDKYEFQMLYGVTPELRASVVAKGNDMRVYVPYGADWFGYSTRRLKENPKMTQHIIKSIFVKG